MNELVVPNELAPAIAGRDEISKLKQYNNWMRDNGVHYLHPDITGYKNYLKDKYTKNSTIQSHLFAVKRSYRSLIIKRDLFYTFVDTELPVADRKAIVDEWINKIKSELDFNSKDIQIVEEHDDNFIRLTKYQVQDLLNQFKEESGYRGQRNYLVMCTLFAFGLRSMELRQLTPADLCNSIGEEPAIEVRCGKGGNQRKVLYGSQIKLQKLLLEFCTDNNIKDDEVIFNISASTLKRIVSRYSVIAQGREQFLKPHDCRRTHAKLCHNAGMLLESIQENLGHASYKTTLRYVGQLSPEKRRPPALFIL